MKIKFTLRVDPDHKIPAIKAIRTATGFGLKEAKDIVDACLADWSSTYPKPVVFSEAQFGRLVVSQESNTDVRSVYWSDVSFFETEASYADFSS